MSINKLSLEAKIWFYSMLVMLACGITLLVPVLWGLL